MKAHVCVLPGAFEQQPIEFVAVDRVQDFALVLAVWLELGAAVAAVDHASSHDDRAREHVLQQADRRERLHPALGQAEVDRAAVAGCLRAWIGAALVDVDGLALASQRERQQRAREAPADDRDPAGVAGRQGVLDCGFETHGATSIDWVCSSVRTCERAWLAAVVALATHSSISAAIR